MHCTGGDCLSQEHSRRRDADVDAGRGDLEETDAGPVREEQMREGPLFVQLSQGKQQHHESFPLVSHTLQYSAVLFTSRTLP